MTVEYTAKVHKKTFLESLFAKTSYSLYKDGKKVNNIYNVDDNIISIIVSLLNQEVNK